MLFEGGKNEIKFDFAHLAESILAESRDRRQSPQTHVSSCSASTQVNVAVSASRTCPLGGSAHTPLAPPCELMAKRPGRRAR